MIQPYKDSTHLVVKSEDQQIVMGIVYAPGVIDADGEVMTAVTIEKMAHDFLLSGKLDRIDLMHNCEPSGCRIVESFLARPGDPDFAAGSWVLAVKVFDPFLWTRIKSGELNGFSFYGWVHRENRIKKISRAAKMAGSTEESTGGPLPPHSHDLEVSFDSDTRVIPAITSETLGHRHLVLKMTATELEMDHGHRLFLN